MKRKIFDAGAVPAERGSDWILSLAKQLGKMVTELIALSPDHDPFKCGTLAHKEQAEWFAKMWQQEYKGQTGIHLRRVHYRLDAVGYPGIHGMPYTNCRLDWCHLAEASRHARILGLVPVDDFEDHRNPDEGELNWRRADVSEPQIGDMGSQLTWSLPALRVDLSLSNCTLETPRVYGYDPDDYLDRAYYLELWIEKSTMDDILVPLTKELGVRLVPAVGMQSISNVIKVLKRIHELKKPARIFYISDADKQGNTMPIAVARQMEFYIDEFARGADIKLTRLALTPEQIAHYNLPVSEDGDRTELDALEALHPGELEKIVRQAVEPYLDKTIDSQLAEAETEANEIVEDEWSDLMEPHQERLQALQRKVQSVTKKYQKEADALNKRLQRDLAQFKKPLAKLQSDVSKTANEFNPSLPDRPAQVETEQDEGNWLFDSARPYLEQIDFYPSYFARKQKRQILLPDEPADESH
jgi:Skp family chaperone for outer membrane proteins